MKDEAHWHYQGKNQALIVLMGNRQVHFRTDWKKVGATMRSCRVHAKISLREMAKYLGKSAPYVSDVELGRRSMKEELLADYFALTLSRSPINNMLIK